MSFLEMKEAAAILGIAPEKLNEMRARNEIHGYRDGSNWKFKQEEVDRVAEAMKSARGCRGGERDQFAQQYGRGEWWQ